MKPIQSIVLGLDLSPECADVWREACAVARTFDAELHLVYAVEEARQGTPAFEVARAGVHARLEEMRQAGALEATRVSPHSIIRAGDPAEAILTAARELDADCIVIGAGARTVSGRVVLGSIAERVVREAEAPVWVVRPGRGHVRFDRVVAAVDPRGPQPEIIHSAALVARTCKGSLVVLAITPEHDGHDLIRRRIQDAVSGTAANAMDVEVYVRGAPKTSVELIDTVQRDDVDLLVMGDSGRPGAPSEANTVEKVLRLVPCSILRVRPPRRGALAGATQQTAAAPA